MAINNIKMCFKYVGFIDTLNELQIFLKKNIQLIANLKEKNQTKNKNLYQKYGQSLDKLFNQNIKDKIKENVILILFFIMR